MVAPLYFSRTQRLHAKSKDWVQGDVLNLDSHFLVFPHLCARTSVRKISFLWGPGAFIPPLPLLFGRRRLNVGSPALPESLFSVGHLTKGCPV